MRSPPRDHRPRPDDRALAAPSCWSSSRRRSPMPGPMAPTGLIKQVKRAACGFRNKQNSGSGYGCTAPGTTSGCQRDEAPCPLKVEERARPSSRDDHPGVRGLAL